ncbi:MAG: hypothetical protein H6R26_605 [Proteobacteria bacterium]|nr:hypothetical protein [Pseudomonadota bacterium]
MAAEYKACDLCSLPVEVEGFELMTRSGVKRFCCEGCVGIYEMLHGDEIVPGESGDPGNDAATVTNT